MRILKCYVLAMSCFTLTFCTKYGEGSEQEETKIQTSSSIGHHENNEVPGAIIPDVNVKQNRNLAYHYNLVKEENIVIKILKEFRTSVESLSEYEDELIKYREICQEIADSLVYIEAPIIPDAKTFDLYCRYFETIEEANKDVLNFFVSFGNILTESCETSYVSKEILLKPTELLYRQIYLFVHYQDFYQTYYNIFRCIENYAIEKNDEALLKKSSKRSEYIEHLSSKMAKLIKNMRKNNNNCV